MDNLIQERVEILLNAEMLDEKTVKAIMDFLDYLNKEHNIETSDKNFGVFISHLSAMYCRIKNGKLVNSLSDEIILDLKSDLNFKKANKLVGILESNLYFNVSKDESYYLILHLLSLFENINKEEKW